MEYVDIYLYIGQYILLCVKCIIYYLFVSNIIINI
jgi:hypothetical protein